MCYWCTLLYYAVFSPSDSQLTPSETNSTDTETTKHSAASLHVKKQCLMSRELTIRTVVLLSENNTLSPLLRCPTFSLDRGISRASIFLRVALMRGRLLIE